MSSNSKAVAPSLLNIHRDNLHANSWNPNVMDAEMMAKERASIRTFGFIDPLTVREDGDGEVGPNGTYEIIDGEQRFRAGTAEGIETFPCILVYADDDEARELTIILNDTRGQMQDEPLARLVQDLSERREAARLQALLPYNQARMEQLLERREIDWDQLEQRRKQLDQQTKNKDENEEPWVERVYRMPADAAGVVDEAVERVMESEEIGQQWRALEMIAAEFLAQ